MDEMMLYSAIQLVIMGQILLWFILFLFKIKALAL